MCARSISRQYLVKVTPKREPCLIAECSIFAQRPVAATVVFRSASQTLHRLRHPSFRSLALSATTIATFNVSAAASKYMEMEFTVDARSKCKAKRPHKGSQTHDVSSSALRVAVSGNQASTDGAATIDVYHHSIIQQNVQWVL